MIDAEFRDLLLFGAFKVAALWGLKAYYDTSRWRIPDQWEVAGRVSKLTFFPLKSCGGVTVNELLATDFAFHATDNDAVRDRHWMVVSADGAFITQRYEPSLALIRVNYDHDHLILSAANMDEMRIPLELSPSNARVKTKLWGNDMEGIDCGDDASTWISTYLNKPGFRIIHMASLSPRMLRDIPKYKGLCQDADKAPYTDQTAYNLTVKESMDDLNSRLKTPMKVERFRGNIVVSGANAPFDEDTWAFIKIGDAIFHRIRPCLRCLLITVDQDTGIKNPEAEPLSTLRSFRCKEPWGISPMFGVSLGIDVCGRIRVGDQVLVARSAAI